MAYNCNEEWESVSENGQVVLCGFYHRYWNMDRTRNQAFDMFSGRILDVKDKKEKGISYFFQQLDEELCKGVAICVVPSHTEAETTQVLQSLPGDLRGMEEWIRWTTC